LCGDAGRCTEGDRGGDGEARKAAAPAELATGSVGGEAALRLGSPLLLLEPSCPASSSGSLPLVGPLAGVPPGPLGAAVDFLVSVLEKKPMGTSLRGDTMKEEEKEKRGDESFRVGAAGLARLEQRCWEEYT